MSKSKKVPKLVKTPTNLTTDVGSASYDPSSGNVSVTLSPELAQFRDLFWNDAMSFAPTEEQTAFANNVSNYGMGLFNQAANLDTNQITQDYYNQMQANLAPSRAMEEARLGDTLFKSGRTGYGTGYLGGGYVNPEQFALLKAREEANANLLLSSEDRARNLQQNDIANAGKYINFGNALQLTPYENVSSLANLGIGLSNQATNLLNPLSTFSQQQLSWQQAQQKNDAARAAAKSGGFLSGLGGGLLSSAVNSFGGGLGDGLGDFARKGIGSWLSASNPATALGTTLLSSGNTPIFPGNYGSFSNDLDFRLGF